VRVSDNTAANALLGLIGGPPAMTEFFRSLGDNVTRLDRYEMELNSNLEGDVRDTTTPDAMLHDLQAILLGNVLGDASLGQLTKWMLNEQNADRACVLGCPRRGAWQTSPAPARTGPSTTSALSGLLKASRSSSPLARTRRALRARRVRPRSRRPRGWRRRSST